MATLAITGATRGVGAALTRRATARGDTVIAFYRTEADLAHFAGIANIHPVLLDLSDTASVRAAFQRVDQLVDGRPLDAMINSAGMSEPGVIELSPIEDFQKHFDINVLGSLRIYQQALPRLRGHWGRMIFVSSLWGAVAGPLLAAYCMSKAALEALADSARREAYAMKTHIIIVRPGTIRTDMYRQQGPMVQRRIDALTSEQAQIYQPLLAGYRDLVGGADGNGIAGYGINADECAAQFDAALFDDSPATRYSVGEDAIGMSALARELSDAEMDAMIVNRFLSPAASA